MKIEKTEYSYHVTECDLKFGEQITLDGELLIPISTLDKIRTKIADFIEDNRPTEVNTDWERGCAYALDEIEKLCNTEK